MRTIDRYLLGKTLWPFAAILGVALLALLMERSVHLMDLLVNKGGPFYIVLRMLANLVPYYLGIALPAAFFIGVLLAVMRLSGESEMDVIQASGVGLYRLLMPVLGLALLLIVVSYLLFAYLQPYTRYGYKALVYLVTETAWNAAVGQGAFFSGFGNTTLMAQDIHDGGRRLSGIFVHSTSSDGQVVTTTTARQGRVFRSRDDLRLILSLESGVRVQTGPRPEDRTVLKFDRLDLPLELAFGVEPFRDRGGSERELTLPELWEVRHNLPPGLSWNDVSAELHGRLVRIVSPVFLPFLAMAVGTASRQASRGAAFTVGIVLVILYHHLLQFGEKLADDGRLSPFVGLWAVFALFCGGSLWLFHAAAMRPGHSPFGMVLERVDQMFHALRAVGQVRRRALP
ncbi:MAG: LptF/LptG family permease [Rhodospirillaceae bacterium]|nr:LptF/LptG family permease [Rhodospirillaceae bacterium]